MKNLHSYTILVFILLLTTACEDFVDIDPPKDQIAHHLVFNDDQMAVAAMNQAYVLMLNNGFLSGNSMGNGFLMACLSDELEVTTAQNTDYRQFYNGGLTASNLAVKSLWDQTYKQVYVVNNILEGLEKATEMSDPVKQQLRGEALAIRGMLHFYLAYTFGDVPYVTSTDYQLNSTLSKTAFAEVVQRAFTDMEQAQNLVSENYPVAERVRIGKKVVHALLARMYLYTEDWALAKNYSELLIEDTDFVMEPLNNVFVKESKSAIWQLQPTIAGMNTYEAYTYVFFNLPTTAKLAPWMLDAFETGDQRRKSWVKTVGSDPLNAHVDKYKKFGFTATTMEYSVVLRIEEMYLIAAEASAQLGEWERCNELINAVRNRAGLPSLELGDISQAQNAVLQERRVELFCEFGHRFYDLKRMGQLDNLKSVKPMWQPHFRLLPIPQDELLLNTNLLPQNQGY